MSYWITRMKCKNCGSECNVSGGMIGMVSQGPTDTQMICHNPNCNVYGFSNFESLGNIDVAEVGKNEWIIRNNNMGNAD